MSRRILICRCAPLSRDWKAAIHDGSDVVAGSTIKRESFAEDAFLSTNVPVVRGHDGARVGEVSGHTTDDRWHILALVEDERDERVGIGTGVSIQAKLLRTDPLLERNDVRRVTLAALDHVALLVDGEIPLYPGAAVIRTIDLPARSPTPTTIARSSASTGEEIIHNEPGAMLRRYHPSKITIR